MTRKHRARIDPLEPAIERALAPSRFVSYNSTFDFVRELGEVERQLRRLIPTEPIRTFALYEAFLAGLLRERGGDRRLERQPSSMLGGFMAGFEEIVARSGPSEKPSFLKRAKARWSRARTEERSSTPRDTRVRLAGKLQR